MDENNWEPAEQYELHIDEVINTLLESTQTNPIKLKYEDCVAVSFVAKTIFEKEPMMLEISAPIHVCGDIHGQFRDLLRLFDLCSLPPQSKYLFLGDYVDRGIFGLECVTLLFCLKIRHPKHIYLLRGNHECDTLNRSYGFRAEIRSKYCSSKIWRCVLKAFDMLPVCAVVDNTIFCCHGGLSPILLEPKVTCLADTLNCISRPCDVTMEGLVCDLLWSDPTDGGDEDDVENPMGWEENERGCSWTFGHDIVEQFLQKFNLDLIVRGHQVVEDGYEFYCDRKLITVFTAPNYCGKFDNAGGVLVLSKNYDTPQGVPPIVEGRFIIMRPNYNIRGQWEEIPKCPSLQERRANKKAKTVTSSKTPNSSPAPMEDPVDLNNVTSTDTYYHDDVESPED